MRRAPTLLLVAPLVLAACGGAPPPPPAVASVAVAPAPPPTAAVEAPAPAPAPALPRSAAVVASLDLGAIERALPEGTLARALEQLGGLRGVDRSRPVTLAVAGPPPAAQRSITALRAMVPAAEPAGTHEGVPVDKVLAVVEGAPAAIAARILVPATDPGAVQETLAAFLGREHFRRPSSVWTQGDTRVAIAAAAGMVVVDVASGPGAAAALDALRAEAAEGAPDAAPPLEGRALVARYSPLAMADVGFLVGVAKIRSALRVGNIDLGLRARLAAQGLWEAAQAYTLSGSARGAFFEQLKLSLRIAPGKIDAEVEAVPGPGFVGPKEDAWAASTSIEARGATGLLDVAEAFVNGWPLPGDAADDTDPRRFLKLVKDAGWGGYVAGLPQLLPWAGRLLAWEKARKVLKVERPIAFARHGLFESPATGREVFFGVFPQKTSRAAAECALVGKAPCAGPKKLKLGGVVGDGGHAVRLASVDGRLVLIAGDKESVGAALVTRKVGPMLWDLPLHKVIARTPLEAAKATFPNHLLGSVERRAGSIVLRMVTP